MTPVGLYWCRTCGRDGRNFGDRLGPALLDRFGLISEWASPADAELVTAGSVLSKFPATWRGAVLGTGLIEARMRADLRRARVLAVRGELTREAAGLRPGVPLGDPGILVPLLLSRPAARPADGYTAIVPHYVDRTMADRHPSARFVDICGDPGEILEAIAGAALVYTSSLHALIAADALGVPHVLELAATIGGLHKFRDYASAFEETIEPETPRLTDRGAMVRRQRELFALFEDYAAERGARSPRDRVRAVTGAEAATGSLITLRGHAGPADGR
jgi:hypothetical protein